MSVWGCEVQTSGLELRFVTLIAKIINQGLECELAVPDKL